MGDVTAILQRMDAGDPTAASELLPLVYDELRRLAQRGMRPQAAGHTLQATALVNEAWLRLGQPEASNGFNGREHFMRTAARAMRQVLIDHARGRSAEKRGGGAGRVELDVIDATGFDLAVDPTDLLHVEDALHALELEDPELAEVVELRYFGGYSMPEVAQLTAVSLSTAERRWRIAKAW